MKEKNSSTGQSPRQRYDQLSRQAVEVPALPELDLKELPPGCVAVRVSISGGLVQEVSLLNQARHPIYVTVRDHDAYNQDPWNYQDADWFLT